MAAGLFMSLDGVVEAPDQWTGPYFGPEVGTIIASLMGAGDTLLLGRVTYETFAAAFGTDSTDSPIAAQMNSIRKVVVSTTLTSADWQNSTLLSHDVPAALCSLKEEEARKTNLAAAPRARRFPASTRFARRVAPARLPCRGRPWPSTV
jgi:dihydrofolate reductase